jgi:hypothetical protein
MSVVVFPYAIGPLSWQSYGYDESWSYSLLTQVFWCLYSAYILDYTRRLAENSSPFRQETQAVTVNQVQSALPVDGALVEFVSYRRFDRKMLAATDRFAERRYVAFVLRRSGKPVWIELGDAAAIDASVNSLSDFS